MSKKETTVTEVSKPSSETNGNKTLLFSSRPSAGFPAPGDDQVERALDINDLVVKNPASTFFVRVSGDSMVGAGIFSDDVLVIDRSVDPSNGKIVVAAINGELVIKRLHQPSSRQGLELVSENDEYEPIKVSEDENCVVWGVVVGSVRQFK